MPLNQTTTNKQRRKKNQSKRNSNLNSMQKWNFGIFISIDFWFTEYSSTKILPATTTTKRT